MVLPQCSSGKIVMLSVVCGFSKHVHGLGSYQAAHASVHRLDSSLVNSTLSTQKPLSNAALEALVMKEILGRGGQQKKPNELLKRIIRMQVETCVHMKHSWTSDFKAYEKCLELLLNVCHPGSDRVMDGDAWETPTGKGFCRVYFTQVCVDLVERKPRSLGYEERLGKCDPHMKELCAQDENKHMDRDEIQGLCQRYFGSRGTTTTLAEGADASKQSRKMSTTTTSTTMSTTTAITTATTTTLSMERTSPNVTTVARRSASIVGAGSTHGTNGDSNEVGQEVRWWWWLTFDVALGLCMIGLCCFVLLLLLKKPASDDEDTANENVAN